MNLQGRLSQQFKKAHPMDQMVQYHLDSGGKYLRGQLALAEGEAVQLDPEVSMTWAMTCELLHNATLIHDDIQDNDPIRRGQTSLWKKYGVAQAINAGDLLIFRSFKLASQLNSPLLLKILAEIAEKLVHGQADEFEQVPFNAFDGYWSSYLEMAQLKTGTLFLLPIHGIHVLKNHQQYFSQEQDWLDLGICYQIIDDIRDFLGQKQNGQIQKDFEEKKINALIAWLSKNSENHDLIHDYLSTPATSAKHELIVKLITETIQKKNIIEHLQKLTLEKLHLFKSNTEKVTQNVVLKYLEPATNQWMNKNDQR